MRGCLTQKKNMFEIVAAHGIPYAATASIGYLNDFIRKVEHAATIRGTKYIHVMAPCPTGWGCDVDETVDISKDIVDCGPVVSGRVRGLGVQAEPQPARVRQRRSLPAPSRPASRLLPTRTSPRWKPPATRSGRSCGETGRSETQYRHEQDEGRRLQRRPSFIFYRIQNKSYDILLPIKRLIGGLMSKDLTAQDIKAHSKEVRLDAAGFRSFAWIG